MGVAKTFSRDPFIMHQMGKVKQHLSVNINM